MSGLLEVWVTPGLEIIGMLSNILNLAILSSKRFDKEDFVVKSLKAFSVFHFIYVSFSFSLVTLSEWSEHHNNYNLPYLNKYGVPFITPVLSVLIWSTVFLAIERYFSFPDSRMPPRMDWCTKRYFLRFILPLWIVSFILEIPSFFEYDLDYVFFWDEEGLEPKTKPITRHSEMLTDDNYLTFRIIFRLVFLQAIPLITMLVFNILTHLKLTRNPGFTALDAQPSFTRNIIMSRLSVVVIYVYSFLETMSLLIAIIVVAFIDTHLNLNDTQDVTMWYEALMLLLEIINAIGKAASISNFPICCYFWQTFRETISDFFHDKVFHRLYHLGLGRQPRPVVPTDVTTERIIVQD